MLYEVLKYPQIDDDAFFGSKKLVKGRPHWVKHKFVSAHNIWE